MNVSTLTLFASLLLGSVTSPGRTSGEPEDFGENRQKEAIARALEDEGVEISHLDLLEVEEMDLQTLSWSAVHVRLVSRVPSLEAVLIYGEEGWKPTLMNKQLSQEWRQSLEGLLRETPTPEGGWREELAQDLVRLLVDPNSRFGKVVSSRREIPTMDPLSDRYRDLVSEGLSPEEISAALLRPLETEIHPVSIKTSSSGAVISFWSWHFFGGEVSSWKIRFGKKPRARKHLQCKEVGSWKHYY